MNREESNFAGSNIKLELWRLAFPTVNGGGKNGSQNGQNNGNGSQSSRSSRLMFDPLSELIGNILGFIKEKWV